MRPYLVALALAVLIGLPSISRAGLYGYPVAARGLLQFAYESCGPTYGTSPGCGGTGISPDARLDDMASLGFSGVMNYNVQSATPAQLADYIDHAYADGILNIIGMNGMTKFTYASYSSDAFDYPLTTTCTNPNTHAACSTIDDYIEYIVSLAQTHAGTWGYYVWDEASVNDTCSTTVVTQAQQEINDIRAVDTTHPIFILLPWYNIANQTDMTDQTGCWTDSASKLYIGIDYYNYDNGGSYPGWLAAAVTANAAKGVIGGIFVSKAFSNSIYQVNNSVNNTLLTTTNGAISAGASSFVVTSATGISAGNDLMISDGGGTQSASPPYAVNNISEAVHVTGVSGTTISVSPSFSAAHVTGKNVYVGTNACSPSAVWTCQPYPTLAQMQAYKSNTLAAGIPKLLYGYYSYEDTAQAEVPGDPTTIVNKRSTLCQAVGKPSC